MSDYFRHIFHKNGKLPINKLTIQCTKNEGRWDFYYNLKCCVCLISLGSLPFSGGEGGEVDVGDIGGGERYCDEGRV